MECSEEDKLVYAQVNTADTSEWKLVEPTQDYKLYLADTGANVHVVQIRFSLTTSKIHTIKVESM